MASISPSSRALVNRSRTMLSVGGSGEARSIDPAEGSATDASGVGSVSSGCEPSCRTVAGASAASTPDVASPATRVASSLPPSDVDPAKEHLHPPRQTGALPLHYSDTLRRCDTCGIGSSRRLVERQALQCAPPPRRKGTPLPHDAPTPSPGQSASSPPLPESVPTNSPLAGTFQPFRGVARRAFVRVQRR